MKNSDKITYLLNQVIEVAKGITPQEGEEIFRSNIFQDVMFAVESGNNNQEKSLRDKLQMKLGLGDETASFRSQKGFPKAKLYYVTFSNKSRYAGYYAEVWALGKYDACNVAGEEYGWLVWSQILDKKPEGMELLTPERKKEIDAPVKFIPANDNVDDIIDETVKTMEREIDFVLKQPKHYTETKTSDHLPASPDSSLKKEESLKKARPAFDRVGYLKSQGLDEWGNPLRG